MCSSDLTVFYYGNQAHNGNYCIIGVCDISGVEEYLYRHIECAGAWARLVCDYRLTWEMLPDAALAEPEVWSALRTDEPGSYFRRKSTHLSADRAADQREDPAWGIPAGREAAFRDRSCHDLQSEPQYGRASVFGIDPFGDRGDAAGRGDVRYPGRGNVGADGARDETGADDGFPAIGAGARDFRR